MVEFSIWDILRNLLMAARWTVTLSLIAFIGGGLVGLLLLVARLSKLRGAERAVGAYVQVFQGTPLLMQLFLAYLGIALFGIKTSPWTAAAVALTLYTSAYLTEIWRGCVAAIPKGQWEAAQSLALNFAEQLRHVVLPQALRIAVPPTVGFLVQVIKGTALASVIGFVELAKAGSISAWPLRAPWRWSRRCCCATRSPRRSTLSWWARCCAWSNRWRKRA